MTHLWSPSARFKRASSKIHRTFLAIAWKAKSEIAQGKEALQGQRRPGERMKIISQPGGLQEACSNKSLAALQAAMHKLS